MRPTKSQPKLKFSVNKYPNFFTDKKWDDPMFMDNRNAQSQELVNTIASYSSMTIQPRAKLTLSLHQKVGAVLSDSRKIGMIEKVDNVSTRKSLAKISYVSTLPPIKTQTQQTEEYLRKLKNELNEVSLQSIKTSKQVSNLQASINQTKQKCRVLQEILGRTGQKELKEISDRKQVTEQLRYSHDVRMNMHENLKLDIQVLSKCKRLLQQKLKTLKIQLSSLNTRLNNSMTSLNNNIYTQREYKNKQELTSEEIMIRSEIAQNKITHQQNAQRTHHKIEAIQGYGEDQFRYETNLQNHFASLKQLRTQQVLSKMLECLFHKYQLYWQQYEKSYGLMKMYSNLNQGTQKLKSSIKTQSITANKLVKNLSIKSNDSIKPLEEDGGMDISTAYENTFTYKNELKTLIEEKQKIVIQLEQKKEKLYSLWASKTFEDSVTQGAKMPQKKIDFSKQIKNLMEKQKRAEKNKLAEQEIRIWLERQQDKLNFLFSKKMTDGDKINKILEYLKGECSNFKSSQIKKEKYSQVNQVNAKSTTKKNKK